MSSIITIRDLEKTFGAVVAARDISIDVEPLKTIGIIGANGAGKTTFVNMITGHIAPSKGKIIFRGEEVTGLPSRRITRMGICRSFQVAQIFPSLTVFDNLCAATAIARHQTSVFGYALTPLKDDEVVARVNEALSLFQIGKFRDAPAATLAQGVRKLLDIAMAVAGAPEVLLLDEPTSGISIEEKYDLMEIVMAALEKRNITVLFVEHDMEIVERYAKRVLAFYDGTIISDGPPELVLSDPRVREFITGESATHRGHANA